MSELRLGIPNPGAPTLGLEFGEGTRSGADVECGKKSGCLGGEAGTRGSREGEVEPRTVLRVRAARVGLCQGRGSQGGVGVEEKSVQR